MKEDMVSHPKHYEGYTGKIECIEFTRLMPFSLGNAFKYLWRAGKKGGPEKEIEDLEKALWYLKDHREHIEKSAMGKLLEKLCYFLKLGGSDDVEKERLKTLFSFIQDSIDDGGSNKAEAWRRIALWHTVEGQCYMAEEVVKRKIEALKSPTAPVSNCPFLTPKGTLLNGIVKKHVTEVRDQLRLAGLRLTKVRVPISVWPYPIPSGIEASGISIESIVGKDFEYTVERIEK